MAVNPAELTRQWGKRCWSIAAATGLRQMLPRQTTRMERIMNVVHSIGMGTKMSCQNKHSVRLVGGGKTSSLGSA